MEITFEQLTHENYNAACAIDRDDIPESFFEDIAPYLYKAEAMEA